MIGPAVQVPLIAAAAGWGSALAVPVVVVAIVCSILAAEMLSYGTKTGLWFVRQTVRLLPEYKRERYEEEWSADVLAKSDGDKHHLSAMLWGALTVWAAIAQSGVRERLTAYVRSDQGDRLGARMVFGMVYGLHSGLFGWLDFGQVFGLALGLAFGLVAGLAFGPTLIRYDGLFCGLVFGVVFGLVGMQALGLVYGPVVGTVGFVAGLSNWFAPILGARLMNGIRARLT